MILPAFHLADFPKKDALQFEQVGMIRTDIRALLQTPHDVVQHRRAGVRTHSVTLLVRKPYW